MVAEGRSVAEALFAYDEATLHLSDVGLAVDLGRRALVRAAAKNSGAIGFAGELFAEAASYYVSRDLPSFVAAPDHILNSSSAIALKEELRNVARQAAFIAGEPADDRRGWNRYVARVITVLQARETPPR
jgi:hypothetical protein